MYTFIAYKSDSNDYGCGYRMASYSSDFGFAPYLNRDELIRKWASYLLKNKNLDYHESGYEFYILNGEYQVFEVNNPYCYLANYFTNEEYEERYVELEAKQTTLLENITDIYNKAEATASILFEQQKQLEAIEKAKKQEEQNKRDKEQRLKQFETLKKEFGN